MSAPSFPMQPGPLYVLVPRKVNIFGVCMKRLPCQDNYLIEESHSSSKGSNAVISYLPPLLSELWAEEKDVHLHCGNYNGQNKNQYVVAYVKRTIRMSPHHLLELSCHGSHLVCT